MTRLRSSATPLASLFLVAVAACSAADDSDLSRSKAASTKAPGAATEKGESAPAESAKDQPSFNTPAAAATKKPSLADQTPTPGKQLTSPREVLNAGAFTAQAPAVRANDRHATPVTGKDCMTCHGNGGSAPHFAYGGTIALGKKWVVGTPAWTKTAPADRSPDSYYGDGDGGYDDYGGYGSDYCDDDGYGSSDEYGSYDSYGAGGDDDDYDYGGGGSCGKRGWPSDRSYPSPGTGVRIVGADGAIFDAVTDEDGNFWFKSKTDVAVPAYTGIKYGTFTVTGSTNGIACGSCHESGAADSPGRLWTWNGPTPR